jgi:hypothetical protein
MNGPGPQLGRWEPQLGGRRLASVCDSPMGYATESAMGPVGVWGMVDADKGWHMVKRHRNRRRMEIGMGMGSPQTC